MTYAFRNAIAETVFNQKYKHEGCETWPDLCRVLVEDVCAGDMCKDDKDQLIQYMIDMKCIAGGRYLYYAGRPLKYFNNCLRAGTNVLTSTGWRDVAHLGTHDVVSPVDGEIRSAEFVSHGVQPVYKYTFVPVRGRSKITWEVFATRNHKWALKHGGTTEELRVGDVIPSNTKQVGHDDFAFAHGFVFGDGNANGQLRLCGDKVKHLDRLSVVGSVTYPPSSGEEPNLYFGYTSADWKNLPIGKDAAYIANFIQGWLAADGGTSNTLTSVCESNLLWFREHAAFAGVTIVGNLRYQIRDVKLSGKEYNEHKIFIQSYRHGIEHAGFKLASVEYVADEEVFCPFEPIHNQIVIDHNIHTYQCYLMRAEEDTRQDWANLSWKCENALMTGGGIGVDYSVYREEGARLSRTGGVASGPISKMDMINEIGRRVMQGGSRRSAIYASLNWQHVDAQKFIVTKDWHLLGVPGTDLTVSDLKKLDFNWHAPLDMTNISLNYDTAWLEGYRRTGEVGETFEKNTRQALMGAEPGFSFNFYDKERETLRNACCELTSEDDSDVCNLGSVNLGNITDLAEFRDVTYLMTKFLVCGTLRADLPYDKVYKVRDKNRRVGLGLMGIHEWLLKRGHRYEVGPELRMWLSTWAIDSDEAADSTAYSLGINKPKGKRAIAPTGTIGMLAGTTTGIEPIFAVAYKRRYLKAKHWHMQYVVDSTAQELVNLTGCDPGKVETAIDLAADPERRIAFQADVQDYVDHAISSTINLPAWGSELNNEHLVEWFANTLAKYAHRLRGFTCYPNGARGGQPLTSVPYKDAANRTGVEYKEHDICEFTGHGGSCGV